MTKPLNILFFMEDLCFGGTQKQTLELASRLGRGLFRPSMLTITGPTDLDEAAVKGGVPLFHMGKSRKRAPFFFARLWAHLRDIKPDILVNCTALPNIWGRLWGRALRIPVIVGTARGGGAPMRQHERALWRLADHIVCNSPALVEELRKRGASDDHLSYIPNGVDTERFKPGKSEKPIILCAARLSRDKDHETLIKAFASVAPKFPDATLRLVGDGPEEAHLKKFTLRTLPESIAGRVEFAGASLDMRPHYREAGIFALASRREGMPNVIMEAMSCGLPVCATNTGGIPVLVAGNECGLLCAPGDVQAMAKNLAVFLENPSLGRQFGKKGRKRMEEGYSFSGMTHMHEELFLKLWERHAHKRYSR